MKLIVCVLLLVLTGCKSITSCFIVELSTKPPLPEDTKLIRSPEYQKEIDELLAVDAENKKWERIYLSEIATAQENNDNDAYKFFIVEYINIRRLILPRWLKDEPGYVSQISAEEILRDRFMKMQTH